MDLFIGCLFPFRAADRETLWHLLPSLFSLCELRQANSTVQISLKRCRAWPKSLLGFKRLQGLCQLRKILQKRACCWRRARVAGGRGTRCGALW
jgi:hypothetical protein